ncbi:EamA family transporter [Effusibacillus pohliae]|uniref:EamA family transporter n=1 Tax=Effusibacillus pohliae TaxID=232270 RepID=UPI00036EE6BB|nr:EamA family transporter [Effusibacillus pohliae]
MAGNFANMAALSWAVLRSHEIRQEWAMNWRTVLLGGVMAPGGYLLFLYAAGMASVSQLAPMREIGTVFGTVLGILVLRERQAVRRILSSVLITTGVIMLGIWGK